MKVIKINKSEIRSLNCVSFQYLKELAPEIKGWEPGDTFNAYGLDDFRYPLGYGKRIVKFVLV